MPKDMGDAASRPALPPYGQSPTVSGRAGIAIADFRSFGFDATGGKLGVTPILWRLRMQYKWVDYLADEYPDWDQCCTCHVFAVTEREARAKVWSTFTPPSVMPISIASCEPERFRNQHDDELEQRRTAQGIEAAAAAETGTGSVHESPVGGHADAPNPELRSPSHKDTGHGT